MTVIYISKDQAQSMRFEDPRNKLLVRACFYLGYSVLFTAELISSPIRLGEAEQILDTAICLGMNDNDRVEVREKDQTTE